MHNCITSATALAAAASVVAALAGCSGGGAMQTTPPAQRALASNAASHPAAAFKTVHVFSRAHGSGDGTNPPSDLLDLEGKLYGTTNAGGANDQGAVFAITPAGDEKIVYSFRGGSDGEIPYAGAIAVNGTLYGTTYYGGASHCQYFYVGCGIVYSLSPAGTEKVLHRFAGVADGAFPEAALTSVNGVLYGTTYAGGKTNFCHNGCGTVFAVTQGGAEKVLHAFSGGNDGAQPYAGLIDVKGVLYGTTSIGGGSGCTYQMGCGTVFAITPSGTEKVLYRFAGGIDGEQPAASLIAENGVLYGTTLFGGGKKGACGTVFRLTLAGTKQKLHTFDQTDGCAPNAKLIDVDGTLYGTTQGWDSDHGTLFSISTSGVFKKLYSFPGGAGGDTPKSGLTNESGTLFGTAFYGGSWSGCRNGCGTVFAYTP
jgi:uncharacterized repeat protein (TIGR03803 family)